MPQVWILLFVFLFSTLSAHAEIKSSVIYGEDNRLDLYQITDPSVRSAAESTLAVIETYKLSSSINGRVNISTEIFGNEMRLCTDEPFWSQPTGSFCSSFLVGEDLVATAGHCITPSLCKDTSFIFGFHLADVTSRATDVAAKDVYRCKEIVMRQYNSTIDYALVRLDRKVVDQKPLTLAKQPAAEGEEILVIGNPSGLPTKISAGASVRSVQGSYFVANLDTYQGNSGSAVFRQSTGEVIGILVRGESDFKYEASKSCYKSNLCADAGCRGEDSTNISFILNAMTN